MSEKEIKPEPVALALSGDAKEKSRRDRTVQMIRCFKGILKGGHFGKLTRAETRSIKREIDFLGSLKLEDFRDRKSPFGRRFPVYLVEAVPSFVLSQFLKFSSSADLGWACMPIAPRFRKCAICLPSSLRFG